MSKQPIRGAYIARLDMASPHLSGVARKIGAQIAALDEAGLPCTLYAKSGSAIIAGETVLRPAARGRIGRSLAHHLHFYRTVGEQLSGADWIYLRYQGADPVQIAMLKRFRSSKPGAPVLMEIPTWPYAGERKGFRDKALGTIDDAFMPGLCRQVDAIVTFSRETEIFGRPTIRTNNGVDVDVMPLAEAPAGGDPFRIVAVANLAFWHGYDRVIAGLAEYRKAGGTRAVRFDVIGNGKEFDALRQQAASLGVEDMVEFQGPRIGADLDAAMNGAHVGVGAMGIHRLVRDSSDLKTREYCARGLPFLTCQEEADFASVSDCTWRVPQDESPVDIADIIAWRDALGDPRAKLRAHAEANLSWRSKLAPVIAELKERLGRAG